MSALKLSWQRPGLPAIVFLIGILSIILLLWVDSINEKLHNDSDLVDAIMDIQIHNATGHLWLEEALAGKTSIVAKDALAAMDQAINLADVTLAGGKSEHDLISEPLSEPPLRTRMESIRSLLLEFRQIAQERLRNPEKSRIGSASDYRFNTLFKEVQLKLRALEDQIERDEVRNKGTSGSLFLGILAVWAFIVVAATAGIWNSENKRRSAEHELRNAHGQLLSQALLLTEHREHLAELVERRTAELTAANELIRVEMADRLQTCETLKETEKQIRELSTRLINAQEIERKRISMGLHDELGQALNVTKLRIRVIERELREDQRALREKCEELLEYMDHVIEDVRRLSLALSPTILKDLGLTSALRWLINNLTKIPAMNVTSEIEEIDHLFPESHWIAIYRVVQEVLTNIGKHAQAENVTIDIRRCDDSVAFSVQDDGKGFDLNQPSMKDVAEKGFGLMTMDERVKMMGGVFALWSQEGKGTRLDFRIPVEKGDA